MDLRFPPITSTPGTSASAGVRIGTGSSSANATSGGSSAGFSTALSDALKSVSAAQNDSVALQKEVQMENPAVSLEETMVAIQKAQIGFAAALNVRNRMVQAYTDIMNMQV
ncbi:MAG: flagellar hook-basal body complex protein FliE [Curvibacter sp.]|nr:flagellar hook-basal body complex protein FliE [Curvibacter sp.]